MHAGSCDGRLLCLKDCLACKRLSVYACNCAAPVLLWPACVCAHSAVLQSWWTFILSGLPGSTCAHLCRVDALKERELPVLRKKAAELQAEVVQLEGRESELADWVAAVSLDAKVRWLLDATKKHAACVVLGQSGLALAKPSRTGA